MVEIHIISISGVIIWVAWGEVWSTGLNWHKVLPGSNSTQWITFDLQTDQNFSPAIPYEDKNLEYEHQPWITVSTHQSFTCSTVHVITFSLALTHHSIVQCFSQKISFYKNHSVFFLIKQLFILFNFDIVLITMYLMMMADVWSIYFVLAMPIWDLTLPFLVMMTIILKWLILGWNWPGDLK